MRSSPTARMFDFPLFFFLSRTLFYHSKSSRSPNWLPREMKREVVNRSRLKSSCFFRVSLLHGKCRLPGETAAASTHGASQQKAPQLASISLQSCCRLSRTILNWAGTGSRFSVLNGSGCKGFCFPWCSGKIPVGGCRTNSSASKSELKRPRNSCLCYKAAPSISFDNIWRNPCYLDSVFYYTVGPLITKLTGFVTWKLVETCFPCKCRNTFQAPKNLKIFFFYKS